MLNPNKTFIRQQQSGKTSISSCFRWPIILSLLALSMFSQPALAAPATTFHVSPTGSDNNTGTQQQPFQTIHRAQRAVRESKRRGQDVLQVVLGKGTYYLSAPVVFTEADSGSATAPVIWTAAEGSTAVISGGTKLDLTWKPYRNGILQAATPAGLSIDQLFINGQRQRMARHPNYDPNVLVYSGYAADAFAPERAAGWARPEGGFIHAMHVHRWGGYHYQITGRASDGTLQYEGGWQNNRQMGMHPHHRFVENIFEELDAEHEWFHDPTTNTLYYFPPQGINPSGMTVEVVRLRHLIEFTGTTTASPQHIELRGLVFRHAARTFMDTKEPLLRSDWTIYRGGAVRFENAKNCHIVDCEFDQVGGNAIFVNQRNHKIVIKGTHIHGAGGSGICFVGSPTAVRNPLFEYRQTQSYADIDTTPGPKNDNYPHDCSVEDCLIHEIGIVEKQAAGVQISMSKAITVSHCSIYDIGRAGINISEGTFGGHLIEFCDVFDTVLETGDHGSFNSWGRDRFWHLNDVPEGKLPEIALLDAEKTIIRNSRWSCDHGWDVDLDDGSSNYEIVNNLFLKGGLKLREGFFRTVRNNIAINNTLHPHVWYPDSGDIVTGNIWMTAYRPARMNYWGEKIDENFFTTTAGRDAFQKVGCDLNSVAGDPQFIDPATGDYRIGPDSSAKAIGFENFPMDQFGVQSPHLRSIARTPVFPTPRNVTASARAPNTKTTKWLGAEFQTIQGESFSAFGISSEDGGLHLTAVPERSTAYQSGLREDDVIQQLNGRPVKSGAGFLRLIKRMPAGRKVTLKIVRSQQSQEISVPLPSSR
ncbi:MAG: PDZ domain-containing protein [Planctomycetaceae bacterium]|nr:PDZ domain-containing protein [Planctomycetaceae bacterium]